MSGSASARALRRLAASRTRWTPATPAIVVGVDRPGSLCSMADPLSRHHLLGSVRGYAKGEKQMSRASMERSITPPAFASQSRGTQIRAFLKSPGVIADPYRGPRQWPSIGSFFGGEGWRLLGKALLRPVQDVWTLGQCQSIKGFTRTAFRTEAQTLYREINRMIALNNHTALRHVCSEKALAEIKKEVKRREKGGWHDVHWKLIDFEENTPTVVQGRVVAPNENDRSVSFVQFTVVFKSKQQWHARDKKGRLVAGDPDETIDVEDAWVFEHGLKVPNPRWRLAARLSVPNPGTTVGGATLDPTIGTPLS
jgi:large subunit ribosomal protein L45